MPRTQPVLLNHKSKANDTIYCTNAMHTYTKSTPITYFLLLDIVAYLNRGLRFLMNLLRESTRLKLDAGVGVFELGALAEPLLDLVSITT